MLEYALVFAVGVVVGAYGAPKVFALIASVKAYFSTPTPPTV